MIRFVLVITLQFVLWFSAPSIAYSAPGCHPTIVGNQVIYKPTTLCLAGNDFGNFLLDRGSVVTFNLRAKKVIIAKGGGRLSPAKGIKVIAERVESVVPHGSVLIVRTYQAKETKVLVNIKSVPPGALVRITSPQLTVLKARSGSFGFGKDGEHLWQQRAGHEVQRVDQGCTCNTTPLSSSPHNHPLRGGWYFGLILAWLFWLSFLRRRK